MQLSDKDLLVRTEELAHEERRATAKLLRHLREVDRRKLYCDLKFGSLFEYCTTTLKYSDGAAQRRVEAVRLMNSFPEVLDKLVSGDLSLSVVARAQSFFRKEKISVEKKKEILKKLEGQSSKKAQILLLSYSSTTEKHYEEKSRPVSETHTRLEIFVSHEQMALFEKVRGRLAHINSHLSYSDLFQKMAEIVLKTTEPQRNVSPTRQQGRTPSRVLRHEIFKRDHSKCQNCGSQFAPQIDHIQSWARGGQTIPQNLQVLCRNCNQRKAFKEFGTQQFT